MYEPPTPSSRPAPTIWWWYVVLCVLLALLNVGLTYLGFWMLTHDARMSHQYNVPPGTFSQMAPLYIIAGPIFGVGNLILPFLPKRPWTYVLHMTNIIAAGLTCCLAPIAIPVFIGWLKPEAKSLFDFR